MSVQTYVVNGRELGKVVGLICRTRYADRIEQYEKDLKAYERARRGRPEIEDTVSTGGIFGGYRAIGYRTVKHVNGVPEITFHERPREPRWNAWSYTGYDRFMGMSSHASQSGVLASPEVNREILPKRVEGYQAQMQAGLWRDLLSDPITITTDGHVVNGQHRLAAAWSVDWEKVDNDPLFLVVFNVDPQEAILADTSSKRTAKDQATISTKVLAKKSAAEAAAALQEAKRGVKRQKARRTIDTSAEKALTAIS